MNYDVALKSNLPLSIKNKRKKTAPKNGTVRFCHLGMDVN